jgi:hypothetical protein
MKNKPILRKHGRLLKFFLKFEKGRESLEDCPKLVMKDQNTKWKN